MVCLRRFESAPVHMENKHKTTISTNPNQHITTVTNKRLAEMLRSIICLRDTSGRYYFQNPHEAIEIVNEASRRLENYQPREIFNHEAFE